MRKQLPGCLLEPIFPLFWIGVSDIGHSVLVTKVLLRSWSWSQRSYADVRQAGFRVSNPFRGGKRHCGLGWAR